MAKRKPSPRPISIDIFRWSVVAVIGLVVIFCAFLAMSAFLRSARIFSIHDVFVEDKLGEVRLPELDKLKGHNIFQVDLTKVEEKVRGKYPQIGDLKVLRRLPDQIAVTGFLRESLAVAVVNGHFLEVTADGFFLRVSQREGEPLAVIRGLKAPKAASGERVADERLRLAFNVIGTVKSVPALFGLGLREVDITDVRKIVCHFKSDESNLDIYLEAEHLVDRLRTLAQIVGGGDLELSQVNYIDLRFEEPLIGRKKAKK